MIMTFCEFVKAAERNGLTVGMREHGSMPSITVRGKSKACVVAPVYVDGDSVDWFATLAKVHAFAWPRKYEVAR